MLSKDFFIHYLPKIISIFKRNSYRFLIGYLISRATFEFGLYFAREDVNKLYSIVISYLGDVGQIIVLMLKIFFFADNLWVFGLLMFFIILLIYSNIIETKAKHNLLEKHKPVLTSFYLKRPLDSELLSIAIKQKVLLLTGDSFCGKSEIAKRVANKLINKKYFYKRVDNLRDASSFLSPSGSKRVCLIEDPFGHNFTNQSSNEFRKLKDLINNNVKNIIIVTSRLEVLYNVFGKHNLNDYQINKINWINITNENIDFLNRLWSKLAKDNYVLNFNQKVVSTLLTSGKKFQIGQLIHLSKIEELKNIEKDANDIYHLAQVDVEELSEAIINIGNSSWLIISILCVCADTFNGPTLEDLEHILTVSKSKVSGLSKNKFLIGSRIFSDEEKSQKFEFPKYSLKTNNLQNYKEEFSFFENRGYIKYINNEYIFVHPQYIEIGKSVLKKLSTLMQIAVLENIYNIFTCLNVNVAFNTSRSLYFIYSNIGKNNHSKLLKKSYQAFEESIFPKVIDENFLFLLKVFDKIESKSLQDEITHKLSVSDEEDGIEFYDGIPIKSRKSSLNFDRYYPKMKSDNYANISKLINENKQISLENLWQALVYEKINRKSNILNINLIELSLKSNEVFIRNIASYLFFLRKGDIESDHIRQKILEDEHPSVLFNALRGFLQAIPIYNNDVKNNCITFFRDILKKNSILGVRSSNLLTTFSIDYGPESLNWDQFSKEDKELVWNIWGEIFPSFLVSYPNNVKFPHTPRFASTLQDSKSFLLPEQGVNIATNLFNYIETNLHRRLFDGFELAIIDFLIETTVSKPEIRFPLFKKIFSVKDTGFTTYSLSWLLGYWDKITDKEKDTIFNLFNSERIDSRWLKAIAITSYSEPPKDIQKFILDKEDYFKYSNKDFIHNMDGKLFFDALTIFSGHPQPIWWYGYHHQGEKWADIMKYILENNISNGFIISLREYLNDIVNGASSNKWGDWKKFWITILNNSSDIDIIAMELLLMISKCNCNIYNTKFLIKELIDYCESTNKESHFIKIYSDNIEAFTSITTDRDLIDFLGHKNYLRDKILPKLNKHQEMLFILEKIGNSIDKNKQSNLIDSFIEIVKTNPIRLYIIFSIIKKHINNGKILKKSDIKKLLNIQNNIKTKQDEFDKKNNAHYDLEDWNGLHKEYDS
jgi:hypothetical protein